MNVVKVTLEDKGQDFLEMYVSEETCKIIDVQPLGRDFWVGVSVPIRFPGVFAVGKRLPVHNPPDIIFGFLKYKIEKIEHITCEL